MNNSTYCPRIKELRIHYGHTQKYVANYLNISLSTYNKIELGKTSFKSGTLLKLAKLYDVSCDYIVNHLKSDKN